ncbi:MAG: hypothetical protein R3Y43_01545 [Alphaproteobacteria bacterium]
MSKIKAVAFFVIALFLYLFGYKNAINKYKAKGLKNVEEAKKARDCLNDVDRINRLHDKYKR